MMRAVGWALLILGVVVFLLGGLWLLQGLGLVRIDPVACVGECTPLVGPHAGWALTGAVTAGIGASAAFWGRRLTRHRRRGPGRGATSDDPPTHGRVE